MKVQCGKRFCSHFAKCQTNLAGWKECVCPKACRFSAIRPVCGKDISTGKERIYPSMCFLKIRSCRLQRSIKPVRIDKCGEYETALLQTCSYFAFHLLLRTGGGGGGHFMLRQLHSIASNLGEGYLLHQETSFGRAHDIQY